MQRVFRVVETKALTPIGLKTTNAFNRSVRRFGVLNPVLLAEVVDADGVIDLAIIDGNRRVRAALAARLPKIPAVVLKATTKHDRARLTLVCNYMRSANFHTESSAILSLAADEEAAADAARMIGLGPSKIQQLYRKIATMPEPVRQAMYEHRIPVSAATWVGAWPEGLQRELIELLGRRRYVNSTMMKDLREWYAERHPEEFAVAEPAREEVPFDEWSGTSLHVVNIPAPPALQSANVGDEKPESSSDEPDRDHAPALNHQSAMPPSSPPDAILLTEQHRETPRLPTNSLTGPEPQSHVDIATDRPGRQADPTSAPQDGSSIEGHAQTSSAVGPPVAHPAGMVVTASPRPSFADTHAVSIEPPSVASSGPHVSSEASGVVDAASVSEPSSDHRAEQMVAFVVRLDTALREFAREGHAIGVDRSVWVDRAMRAWDGIGG